MEPMNKIIITCGTFRNTYDDIGKIRLFCLEGIAASFDQQHCQVECRSLVAVNEAMIRDNPVNQRGGLFMDAAVITIVRTAKRRPNCMITQNSGSATTGLKCIKMAT